MSESLDPLLDLIRNDKRYALEAYVFVFDALQYAQKVMGLGRPRSTEPAAEGPEEEPEETGDKDRHVTGQELCEAIRRYALDQYGYMAKCVLNSWGVHTTRDFGEIVFNLIEIHHMRKTENDKIEDFDNVFDFDTDMRQSYKINLGEYQSR